MAHSAYYAPNYRRAKVDMRGQACHICGAPSTVVDHWPYPVSSGHPVHVLDSPDNLRPSCRSCSNKQGGLIASRSIKNRWRSQHFR